MKNKKWNKLTAGLVLGVAAFFAAGLGLAQIGGQSVALAQGAVTGTPAASPQATLAPAAAATPMPTAAPTTTTTSSIGNTFWQGLATKLGVNVDTLKASALQQRKDMLDQAVKDGRLTLDRANQLKQQLTADDLISPINIGPGVVMGQQPNSGGQPTTPNRRLPNVNPRMPQANPGVPGSGMAPNIRALPSLNLSSGQSLAMLEAAAKALSLAPAQLVNQLSSGKTLADVATTQKVDPATLKKAIVDARNAELDRQVTDGLITQARATALKARLTVDTLDLSRQGFFSRYR